MDLKIRTKHLDGVPIIELEGEVDVYTAPRLKSRLIDLVDQGKYQIIVDLELVDFMDSSGLGVLVGGLKRVRAHDGAVHIICTKEKILKIFRITGLTKVFPIYGGQEEAVSAFGDAN